jgi:predicted RNA methylase
MQPQAEQAPLGLAGAGPGRRILEPSAGEGAIVAALLSLGAEVVAVEYDASRVATLRARFPGITIVQGDFLAMSPAQIGFFDGVAMNPPFSLAGQPQADIDHVMHAATFAHRGGVVAAIVSQGVEFRDDKKSQTFRAFVAKHRGSIETLPAQSFREVGTDVGSSLVAFVSPGVK